MQTLESFAVHVSTDRKDLIDRRACVRYSCNVAALYQLISARGYELWWPATARNVSSAGIGLLSRRAFEPGTVLDLQLQAKPQTAALTVPARVAHATPAADGCWLVGCAFLDQLSGDQLKALL